MWNYRPEAWVLPGLFIVGLLTLVAMLFKAGPIESDLTERALQNLSSQHSWAKVELDGRNLELSGIAPTKADQDSAVTAADGAIFNRESGTWGVRVVDSTGVKQLPVQSPYAFNAERKDNVVRLSGSIPAESMRSGLVEKALTTVPGATVKDELTLASGAPDKFGDKAGFAIGLLKDASEGTASISDSNIDLTARLEDAQLAKALQLKLEPTISNGLIARNINIDAPEPKAVVVPPVAKVVPAVPVPVTYAMNMEKTSSGVHVGGFALSEEMRKNLVDSANKLDAGTVTEYLTISDRAPQEYSALGGYGIGLLSQLNSGSVKAVGKEVSITGVAPNPTALDRVKNDIQDLPSGLSLKSVDLSVVNVTPYIFSAIKNGSQVILNGNVPSQAARDRVLAKAKNQGFDDVVDNMKVSAGAPAGFEGSSHYSVKMLSHFTDGSALVSDDKIVVDGTAATLGSYDAAGISLKTPPEGFKITSSNVDLPIVSPYAWRASLKDDVVTASGLMPDADSQAAVKPALDSLALGGPVIDNTRLADGNPEGLVWSDGAKFGTRILRDLKSGTASISDGVLSVYGKAATPASYDAAIASTKGALPAGLVIGDVDIERPTVSPFKIGGHQNGETVWIKGYVPSEASGQKIVDKAKGNFGGAFGGADLTIANGAPGGFDDAAKVAVQSLSKLSKGSFEIVDRQATLWGIVPVDGSLEGVQSAFEKGMPAGFSAEAILTQTLPPPPPVEPEPAPEPAPAVQKPEACSASVIAAVTNNTINFQSGRATILSDSFELLDNIAGLVISCPNARFEVAGHTDSDGSEASNQRLSVARAEAVIDYLTRAGVDTTRLVAVGFGESKPVAANDTQANKALNRRIEFNLIEE